MNQSEIFELAKEVGLIDSNAFSKAVVRHSNGSWVDVADDLEEFAKQVAAKEHKAYGANAELLAMLQKATHALAGGLWDYGPGQDEHELCNEVIAECRAAIAKATGQSK